MLFCFAWASAPNPDLLFASGDFIYFGVGDLRFAPIVLTQKVSKKVKRPHPALGYPLPWRGISGKKSLPASLEKLTLSWLFRQLTDQTRSYVAQTGQFQMPT